MYAEKNNVIIIHACGNSNANLDLIKGYPADVVNDVEIVNNFISVAAAVLMLTHFLMIRKQGISGPL